MDTHCSNVGTSLATKPENSHIALDIMLVKLGLINSSNSQLLLDCRNKRGSLENWTCQSLNSLLKGLGLLNVLMKLNDGNILFTSRLLCLDQSSSIVNASDQATCDLGI